jgi:hypothetical protein
MTSTVHNLKQDLNVFGKTLRKRRENSRGGNVQHPRLQSLSGHKTLRAVSSSSCVNASYIVCRTTVLAVLKIVVTSMDPVLKRVWLL